MTTEVNVKVSWDRKKVEYTCKTHICTPYPVIYSFTFFFKETNNLIDSN